jgi:hypothetical protein
MRRWIADVVTPAAFGAIHNMSLSLESRLNGLPPDTRRHAGRLQIVGLSHRRTVE